MAGGAQLGLFGEEVSAAIGPAPASAEVEALARALPDAIRLGTSSWSFPGWRGLVYDRSASASELARSGLAAYARHPLLRAVSLDRTFYAPIDGRAFAAYAAAVPEGFRFLVKAHEVTTLAHFPQHERYGDAAGDPNPRFLDPRWASDRIVAPCAEGLGGKLGAIVFQFPPQPANAFGGAERFAERLSGFLGALPRGPLYAVELRDRSCLAPAVARALADAGAVACLTVHPRMPSLAAQAHAFAPALSRALVLRWNLHAGFHYEAARSRYAPFDRLVDPDPATRASVADLCAAAARAGRPAIVAINNKAEGSAPCSVAALAGAIAERLAAR